MRSPRQPYRALSKMSRKEKLVQAENRMGRQEDEAEGEIPLSGSKNADPPIT